MEAYCMKCKTKREMKDPVASFNAKGSPVTLGICPVCGTKLYRIGKTPAHEGLTPPEKTTKPVKVDETMAFMFETAAIIRPTRFALAAPQRQKNYETIWHGFKKKFK